MKLIKLFPFAALLLLCSFSAPKETAIDVLERMYDRYHGNWQRTLHFVQNTEKYRNDSLISKETWYESLIYPDLFRIDVGTPDQGNCRLYLNDTIYSFKDHKLEKKRQGHNDLLYLIGGIYHERTAKDMVQRIASLHYNTDKMYVTEWKGRKAYVIGADSAAERVNQLFIAQDNFNVLRALTYEDGKKMDVQFDKHIAAGDGWSETLVTFSVDGHLVQKEEYRHVVANLPIDPIMFSPADPWKWHWYSGEK